MPPGHRQQVRAAESPDPPTEPKLGHTGSLPVAHEDPRRRRRQRGHAPPDLHQLRGDDRLDFISEVAIATAVIEGASVPAVLTVAAERACVRFGVAMIDALGYLVARARACHYRQQAAQPP
jgi:hypothetical protein